MDGFIAISNETNEWNFSESFGSIGVDSVDALALMSDGDFIIAGNYCLGSAGLQCNMTLGTLPTLDKNADSDEGNAYIARYDVETGWQWAVSIGNEQETLLFDLFVDEADQIHVGLLFKGLLDVNESIFAGGYHPSLALMMFDTNGLLTNGFSATSQGGIEPFGGFCQNSIGETFVAMTFIQEVVFGEIGFAESNGGGDIVVAKYDETGWSWLQQAGGTGDDLVRRLEPILARPLNGSMPSEPISPPMVRGTGSSLRVAPVTTCTVRRIKQHPVRSFTSV